MRFTEDKKFSVHTFTLSKNITNQPLKSNYIPNEKGIRATLINNSYYQHIEVTVNPHLLITDHITQEDYLKIFTFTKANMKSMETKINEFLKNISPELSCDVMTLSRVDLCVNQYFEYEKMLKTYMKLLKKISYQKTYQLTEFSPDYVDYKTMNKNSVRIYNGQRMITAYNKIFQQKQQGYLNETPETILRIEVALLRRDIYLNYQTYYGIHNTMDLLTYIIGQSENIMKKYILDLHLDLKYVDTATLKELIHDAPFRNKTKHLMYCLVIGIKKTKNINTALEQLKELSSEQNQKRLLKKFQKLGVSSVAIDKKSGVKELPSLYDVLFTQTTK